jgi:hypothetical protein
VRKIVERSMASSVGETGKWKALLKPEKLYNSKRTDNRKKTFKSGSRSGKKRAERDKKK